MLTENKEVTTKEYWTRIFTHKNENAKVDSSNGVRPKNSFDRFQIVVNHVDGQNILGIGSGHAHIEKRIKTKLPDSNVIASDQCDAAKGVANYLPYEIFSAYKIPYTDKYFDLIIATQCLEYMEFQNVALIEFKRVAKNFICTIPIGEMKSWSQLFIYKEESFCDFLKQYGTIEVVENYGELLLVKIKFYE